MAEGRSNLSMAEALVVSERAIEKHVTLTHAGGAFSPAGRTPTVARKCRPVASG